MTNNKNDKEGGMNPLVVGAIGAAVGAVAVGAAVVLTDEERMAFGQIS